MTKRRPPTTTITVNGPALRKLRMERGVEVADLAAQVGISRAWMTQIEVGKRGQLCRVSPSIFKRLVDALQPTSRDDLIADGDLVGSAA